MKTACRKTWTFILQNILNRFQFEFWDLVKWWFRIAYEIGFVYFDNGRTLRLGLVEMASLDNTEGSNRSSAELSQSLSAIQINALKIESEGSQESTPSSVISFKSRSPIPRLISVPISIFSNKIHTRTICFLVTFTCSIKNLVIIPPFLEKIHCEAAENF